MGKQDVKVAKRHILLGEEMVDTFIQRLASRVEFPGTQKYVILPCIEKSRLIENIDEAWNSHRFTEEDRVLLVLFLTTKNLLPIQFKRMERFSFIVEIHADLYRREVSPRETEEAIQKMLSYFQQLQHIQPEHSPSVAGQDRRVMSMPNTEVTEGQNRDTPVHAVRQPTLADSNALSGINQHQKESADDNRPNTTDPTWRKWLKWVSSCALKSFQSGRILPEKPWRDHEEIMSVELIIRMVHTVHPAMEQRLSINLRGHLPATKLYLNMVGDNFNICVNNTESTGEVEKKESNLLTVHFVVGSLSDNVRVMVRSEDAVVGSLSDNVRVMVRSEDAVGGSSTDTNDGQPSIAENGACAMVILMLNSKWSADNVYKNAEVEALVKKLGVPYNSVFPVIDRSGMDESERKLVLRSVYEMLRFAADRLQRVDDLTEND